MIILSAAFTWNKLHDKFAVNDFLSVTLKNLKSFLSKYSIKLSKIKVFFFNGQTMVHKMLYYLYEKTHYKRLEFVRIEYIYIISLFNNFFIIIIIIISSNY